MGNPAKYQAMEARNAYQRLWAAPLTSTCVSAPGFFCFSLCCGNCASYTLRKRALYNDMSRYICCNGNCPCSGRMKEQSCPEACLCLEVFCCFAQSVASTRWMIQDELRIQTTECDRCIIGTMIAMQYFACICSIAACLTGSDEINSLAQLLDLCADILWCSVCACMQTQHHVELKQRDGATPGMVAAPPPMAAPGAMTIPMGGAPPPPGAYPPQGYPAPPPGYPQAPHGMQR